MNTTMTEAPHPVFGPDRQRQPVHPEDVTIFVHLCNGRVDLVTPATRVRVNVDTIDILLGDLLVARYARQDVYFASTSCMSCPSLC
jgi:hypothetical protein